MNELIKINTDSDRPTVMGRELHEALEIGTPYKKWFDRMTEYGFTENIDYAVTDIFVPNSNGGRQTQIDHQLTLDMAKEICMIQRSEKGKACRQYFLEIEKKWNNPETVIARALQLAAKQLDSLKQANFQLEQKNIELSESNDILAGNILKWNCRQSANAIIKLTARAIHKTYPDTWNLVYRELYYKHGINLKARGNRKPPHIAKIKPEEWRKFYESVSAILQVNGVSPSEIFSKVKRSTRVIESEARQS